MDKHEQEVMKEQIDQIVDVQKMLLANDELFIAGAEMCKHSFDALIGVGFNRDDAIRIVAGGGMAVKGK
jgi:hypothetical protein